MNSKNLPNFPIFAEIHTHLAREMVSTIFLHCSRCYTTTSISYDFEKCAEFSDFGRNNIHILRGRVCTESVYTIPVATRQQVFPLNSKNVPNSQISAENHIHIVRRTVCTKCVYTVPVATREPKLST